MSKSMIPVFRRLRDLLTVEEAAAWMGVSRNYILKHFPSHRIGRHRRLFVDECIKVMERSKVKVS